MRMVAFSMAAGLALIAGATREAALAQARGPAFDCAKAQGEVELLICKDEGLAALDRRLDEVYKAALTKARDDVPQFLRAEQRGWIKGRNECWKAKDGTYLTASWQAKDVRECVEGTYKIRISELQALMRLVPPKGPIFYACNDSYGQVIATFFETDPPTARLERGDKTLTAWLVRSASGSRYEGPNVEFWTKGDAATVSWLGTKLECEVKGSARRGESAAPTSGLLADTEWRLTEIQSMDDAVGTVRPADASLYTMRLKGDGTVHMKLNCNRANGTWSAEPSNDTASGRFEFGPIAATRALCPPPSLDERVTAQAPYVRGYLLKAGRLYLSLLADGGVLAWAPLDETSFETEPDAEIEAAILNASPSYTRALLETGGGIDKGRYVHGRVDLNGDGRDEVFVYTLGSIFCGTGGCNLMLFTHGPDGYSLVNDFPISRLPVVVSPRKTAGWSDLFRLESGGGAPASYVRHAFDGKRYVEMERAPADKAPEGKRYLTGELTFDKGIPLEPRY